MSEIRIFLSNNSVRNTTAACDSLGIHYTISKSKDIVQVERWNSTTNEDILVGEFKLLVFSRDVIRFSSDEEWTPLKSFLVRSGNIFSTARAFVGDKGEKYQWKTAWPPQLTMYQDAEKLGEPLVVYHRHRFGSEPSYLEIRDSSVLASLDKIIITFLIMEKERRNREKRRRSGA